MTDTKSTDRAHDQCDAPTQFSRNVAFAWGSYIAQAVAGFVMPRLISDSLGQSTLGLWDFAWSVVTYLGLVQLGLSDSVNRFVARYRAQGDVAAMTRSVSTVSLFLKAAGILALILTGVLTMWVLPRLQPQLGAELPIAQRVVLFLGVEVAVSLMLTVYLGVIVGCLRSDVHYTVSTAVNVVTAIGMAGALFAGGGLPAIALVHFACSAAGDVTRWRLAHRLCPELVVDYSTASWSVWREQARFSAKSTLPTITDAVANQSLNVLIALHLGPAALAIFARPRNLMRQVRTLTARFGNVLIPAASSLYAGAQTDELARTAREKSSQLALLAAPMAVTFVVVGDDLIRLWMGESYVVPSLVAVLAVGALPTWAQEPIWGVLAGMNRHGRLALAKMIALSGGAVLAAVGMWAFDWGLVLVAACIVAPTMIVDGLVAPLVAVKALGIPLGRFYRDTWLRPALAVAPFFACLLLARHVLGATATALAATLVLGAAVLGVTYWIAVFPASARSRILRPARRLI